QAGAEDPERHLRSLAGDGADVAAGYRVAEIVLELEHVAREVVLVRGEGSAERLRGSAVGAGGAAEAQVDAAGEQRLESAELLGDGQRRVVGEHHPAGADANVRRAGADISEGDGGRRAGDPGHRMMLRHPEAVVAEPLAEAGEVEGVTESAAGIAALG